MAFDNYLLFFFSALGVFNGLLLCIYFLLLAKPRHISNVFLGVLLLAICLRVGKSIFFYFNDNLADIYIQTGITGCFFIGPFLFLYIHALLQPEGKIVQYWKPHILLLFISILLLGIFFPYKANRALWQDWFMNAVYFQWFIYLLFTGKLIFPILKKLFQADQKTNTLEFWMSNVYLACCLLWLVYVTSYFTSYISGAISFSVITYLLILSYVFSKKKRSVLYLDNRKQEERKIDPARAQKLLEKLKCLMEEAAPYTKPNLKSEELAKLLDISVHELSTLLNDSLGKRFTDFINEYRVNRSKELMKSMQNYTFEAIGYEAGFNSKSTFYAAFKKITGQSPSKYLKAQKSSANL
ncbi:MAG: helix-turn-helix domain-containing protein [Bacteroidia bacterium]|nr:helix-turn-helix domain-containing protein [Bacteroidia bacterium]